MDIPITKVDENNCRPIPEDESKLGFGQHFSDHMFMMEYNPDEGWHSPRIEPLHDLSLSPAAMVLHYGQEAFEGLKAYRCDDGGVRLFRYRKNFERLNASCERLCMPTLDIDLVSQAMKKLVLLDRKWIPKTEGCALYIRPNIIATDPFLGVRPSNTYLFYIVVGPVGAYYPEGFNPVSIYVSDKYVRAVEGGVGYAKTAGNYAASLLAQREAAEAGYTQVLWLDAKERRYVEEVGTMNIFFKIGDEIITAPLAGSILPGVTRDSVIEILRDWGMNIVERPLGIDEVVAAQQEGALKEVFGSGTAAIVSPVGEICYKDQVYKIGDGQTGALSQKLYDTILDIQYGKAEDKFGWTERIDG